MNKPLHVFFDQRPVGKLTKKADDTLSFQYEESWLTGEQSFPVSPALPLRAEEFDHRATRAYFDNLLPEGETLKILEGILHQSLEDPFQFLDKYGLDCAGAFQITQTEELAEPGGPEKLKKITREELDQVLANGEDLYAHSITIHKAKFSLAGAQDKIPVIFRDGEIFLPLGPTPTTHILKPPARLPGASDSVYNEYFCMKLAESCGLSVPEVSIIGEKIPLYLVERFDRHLSEDKITRLHQFDLCQAQGFPSAEKYESDGGPGFARNYKCIETISDNKIPDLETALHWLAFNLLIGNNDSHSKNLSFLYENGHTRVVPLYDLLSTTIYPKLSGEFAFQIGGQRHWHKLRKKNLEMLAAELGYVKRPKIVAEVISEMSVRVLAGLHTLPAQLEPAVAEAPVVLTLMKEISKRAGFFLRVIHP